MGQHGSFLTTDWFLRSWHRGSAVLASLPYAPRCSTMPAHGRGPLAAFGRLQVQFTEQADIGGDESLHPPLHDLDGRPVVQLLRETGDGRPASLHEHAPDLASSSPPRHPTLPPAGRSRRSSASSDMSPMCSAFCWSMSRKPCLRRSTAVFVLGSFVLKIPGKLSCLS